VSKRARAWALWAVALAGGAAGCRSEAREATTHDPAAARSCGAAGRAAPLKRPGLGGRARPITVGLVADVKELLPATRANLERFARVFRSERARAVVALGGLGSTEEEIARVLAIFKVADAPVFALPGDREPEAAFHAGVARAKSGGLDVTDLAEVRAVDGDGLDLVSLPGYPFPHYLGAGEAGCRYRAAEVGELAALVAALDGDDARLLVAHTPPRGRGPTALDWALGGANVGDPALERLLPSLHVQVAAFAHVDEAGGRALAPDDGGVAPLAPSAWAARLYLNVGAADSVPHPVLGRAGLAHGQAALVEIDGERARYRVIEP
jgi:hypothetical protein